MKLKNVRITGVHIHNLKNVVTGDLPLDNNKKNYRASIVGLYGQNGSGKTALIDSIELLRLALCGQSIPDKFVDYINADSDEATMSFDFRVGTIEEDLNVTYEFTIKRIIDETKQNDNSVQGELQKLIFSHEIIKCPILSERQIKIGRLIDTNGNSIFSPISKRTLLVGNNKETMTDLLVARRLSQKESRSFIFSRELLSVIRKHTKDNDSREIQYYTSIIESLVEFGNHGLFIINTANLGLISLNALPLAFRYVESNEGTLGTVVLSLDDPFLIPQKVKDIVDKIIGSMNIVLWQMIPGLKISVRDLGTQVMENGELGKLIQLMSCKSGKEIPLRNESEGIKKIISILHLLIVVYNHPSVTVAVDELDSGIFEYLLGEILRIISEKGKGQLIFTSHNLRPLETLNRCFIAFTTTNPRHRYLRLTNVKENHNLRDFYYRDIMLGEQNEQLYESTNNSEIAIAFREAGVKSGT